jgi:hypothetical protein
MKRKRVYAHRTLKMREDFLHWLSKKNALQQQEAEKQPGRSGSLASRGPAEDGGREA